MWMWEETQRVGRSLVEWSLRFGVVKCLVLLAINKVKLVVVAQRV